MSLPEDRKLGCSGSITSCRSAGPREGISNELDACSCVGSKDDIPFAMDRSPEVLQNLLSGRVYTSRGSLGGRGFGMRVGIEVVCEIGGELLEVVLGG